MSSSKAKIETVKDVVKNFPSNKFYARQIYEEAIKENKDITKIFVQNALSNTLKNKYVVVHEKTFPRVYMRISAKVKDDQYKATIDDKDELSMVEIGESVYYYIEHLKRKNNELANDMRTTTEKQRSTIGRLMQEINSLKKELELLKTKYEKVVLRVNQSNRTFSLSELASFRKAKK